MSYYSVPLFQIYHSSREYYFHLCTAQSMATLQRHMSPNWTNCWQVAQKTDIGTILLVPTLCANTKFSKVDFVSKETSTSFWTLFSSSFNWPFDDVVKKKKKKTKQNYWWPHSRLFALISSRSPLPYMPPFCWAWFVVVWMPFLGLTRSILHTLLVSLIVCSQWRMLATEDTNKILPNELWLAMDHLGINGCDMLSPPQHKGASPWCWESGSPGI